MSRTPAMTAISRRTASAPLRRLLKDGRITGRVLDFGCGRGRDVEELVAQGYDAWGYDPHWSPERPEGTFDTVVCTYVLNVLPPEGARAVLDAIRLLLRSPTGTAYITVRRDLKEWKAPQRFVALDLPILYENADFATYMLTPGNKHV